MHSGGDRRSQELCERGYHGPHAELGKQTSAIEIHGAEVHARPGRPVTILINW